MHVLHLVCLCSAFIASAKATNSSVSVIQPSSSYQAASTVYNVTNTNTSTVIHQNQNSTVVNGAPSTTAVNGVASSSGNL